MPHDWETITADFADAARWLAHVVAEVRPEQWDQPGLGSWDVRSLVGHASRGISVVEKYLAEAKGSPGERTAAGYLAAIRQVDPAAIAARGVASGEELGDDPAAAVAEAAERVITLVGFRRPDTPTNTAFGTMRLDEYLPTRTFELVVHGLDLAAAIGSASEPPPAAAAATARLVVEAMIDQGKAVALCEGLTGRPVRHGDAQLL